AARARIVQDMDKFTQRSKLEFQTEKSLRIIALRRIRETNIRRTNMAGSLRLDLLGVALTVAAALLPVAGARAADPIKVGVTITQSPPGSVVQGTQVKDGLEVAAKIINDAGGV